MNSLMLKIDILDSSYRFSINLAAENELHDMQFMFHLNVCLQI